MGRPYKGLNQIAKVTLNPLQAGYRSSNSLNTNLDLLEAAIENTISRDGTSPNQMEAPLDMNGERIINLAAAVDANDAVRKADFDAYEDAAAAALAAALEAQDDAEAAVVATAADAASALASKNAAETAQAASEAARDLAEADAVATAADRVQTGLDAAATAADAVATAADRVATEGFKDDAELAATDAETAAETYVLTLADLTSRGQLYALNGFSESLEFVTDGTEALFGGNEYRIGVVDPSDDPADLTSWIFARALDGFAKNADDELVSFASGEPRILSGVGLLIEPEATNILLRTDVPSNGTTWGKTRSSVVENTATAPDGTTTAHKLVENTATNTHILSQSGVTVTSSTTYTMSWYLKAAGRTRAFVGEVTSPTKYAFFDLIGAGSVHQVVGTGVTAAIEALADDWYLVSLTFPTGAAQTTGNFQLHPALTDNVYEGDGTSGLLFWKPQVETGIRPTSRITTTTTAVTRPKDEAEYLVSSAVGTGSLFVEATPGRLASATVVITEWSDVSDNNRVLFSRTSSDTVTLSVVMDDEAFTEALVLGAAGTDLTRLGVTWTGGLFKVWRDGVAVGQITAPRAPVLTQINLGANYLGQSVLGGVVKSVVTFGDAIADATMTRMTRALTASGSQAVRTIAAADSTYAAKLTADIVCDGVNDEVEINAAVAQGGTVLLLDGNYYVNKVTIPDWELMDGQGEEITAAIVLDQSNTTLKGQSRLGTIVHLTDDQRCNVIRTIGEGVENIYIHGFTIDPNRTNNMAISTAWLENCAIKTRTTGTTKNQNIWIYDMHIGRCDGVGVYLFGENVHLRDSSLDACDHDIAELCDGRYGDIIGCTTEIKNGEEAGNCFGTDAFLDFSIDQNTTIVRTGGYIIGGVHRAWKARYRGSFTGNKVISEGGRIHAAFQLWGYDQVATANIVRGHDDYATWGRTKIEVNTTSVFAVNTVSLCQFVTTATDSDIVGGVFPTNAAGVCKIKTNVLYNCEAPEVDAQTDFDDNIEYVFA